MVMKKPKILWHGDKVLKKINEEENKRIHKACIFLENYIKTSMKKGSYKPYKRGKKIHYSSQPGHPPAVDTGRLRASITYEVMQMFYKITGRVGTNVEYARHLELGTKDMQPRPYLRVAIERNKDKLIKILTEPIK